MSFSAKNAPSDHFWAFRSEFMVSRLCALQRWSASGNSLHKVCLVPPGFAYHFLATIVFIFDIDPTDFSPATESITFFMRLLITVLPGFATAFIPYFISSPNSHLMTRFAGCFGWATLEPRNLLGPARAAISPYSLHIAFTTWEPPPCICKPEKRYPTG